MVLCYLKDLLDKKGLTQAWLAEKLKMNPSTLNRIVSGHNSPRTCLAVRIGRLIKVDVESIWPDTPGSYAKRAQPKRRK